MIAAIDDGRRLSQADQLASARRLVGDVSSQELGLSIARLCAVVEDLIRRVERLEGRRR